MTTIDKIRAEIDKWDDSIKDAIGEYADGMRFVLRHFTFVLDTLEEPVSDAMKELDEKIARASKTWEGVDVDEYMDEVRGREPVSEDLEDCLELNEAAEQFVGYDMDRDDLRDYEIGIAAFKAGAEWQKDKDTEAVIVAEDRGFLKGADWARAEMMEDALHGWLDEDNEPPYDLNVICEEKIPFGKFKHCDKIKIIIVKEDGE